MKKRTTALLTAALLLTSLCGTASAANAADSLILSRDAFGMVTVFVEQSEETPETPAAPAYTKGGNYYYYNAVSEGEYGQVDLHTQISSHICYIVTDASGIPADVYTDEDFRYPLHGTELFPRSEEYPANADELLDAYPGDVRLFKMDGSLEWKGHAAYEAMLENAHILGVYEGLLIADSQCIWDGQFILHAPLNEEEASKFDETTGTLRAGEELDERANLVYWFGEELIEEKEALDAEHKEWLAAYSAWRDTVDYDSLTPEERAASIEAAGLMSDWEITKKAIDLAQKFEDAYAVICEEQGWDDDVLQLADLRFSTRPGTDTQYYRAVNIWDKLGDIDQSGALDAADASSILIMAASAGSGGYYANAFVGTSDFNLDGKTNAADAADLLQYLANKGAGNTADLRSYLQGLRRS